MEVGKLQELINIWFLPVFFPTWIDWSREPISAWAYDAGTSTRLETDIASITWPANSGTAVLGFKKSNAVVLLTRGGFSDVAHQAVAGIAMAGTATEQLVSSTTTNDYSVLVSCFACVTDYLCILFDKFYLQRFCIFQCRWVWGDLFLHCQEVAPSLLLLLQKRSQDYLDNRYILFWKPLYQLLSMWKTHHQL